MGCHGSVICFVVLSYSIFAEGFLSTPLFSPALHLREFICKDRDYLLTLTKKVVCWLCKHELSCLDSSISTSTTTAPPKSDTDNTGSPSNEGNIGNQGNQAFSSNQGGSSNGVGKPNNGVNNSSNGGENLSDGEGRPSNGSRRDNEKSDDEESNTDQDSNKETKDDEMSLL